MVSYNVRVALIIFSEHNIKLALAFLKPRANCDIFSPSLSALYLLSLWNEIFSAGNTGK